MYRLRTSRFNSKFIKTRIPRRDIYQLKGNLKVSLPFSNSKKKLICERADGAVFVHR